MERYYRRFGVCAILFCFLITIQNCDNKSSMGVEDSLSVIPDLVLIEEAINSAVTVNPGSDSYFAFELHDISPNNIIGEGKGNGWCIAWNKPIASDNTTHQGMNLYSTHGSEKWKPINYLLNTKYNLKQQYPELTYREIQVAIWYLLDFPAFDLHQINVDELPSRMVRNGEFNFDLQKVTQIVQHVNQNYQSYQYNSASIFAVVVETPSDTQTVIIEVDESVWAFGQHSFRSPEIRDRLGITVEGRGQWGWIYEMETDYETTELIAGGGDDDGTKAADEVGTIIGSLEMMRGNDQFEITYSTFSGYLINDLHLWVGCSLDDFPGVGQAGNVAPGQLPYSYEDEPTDSHTFRISLSELSCDSNHFIAAHAGELFQVKKVDLPDEPVFTIFDLSKLGLNEAVDINDNGHIVGGQNYWNPDTGILMDIGISTRAINNNGQVISSSQHWDELTGITEFDVIDCTDTINNWTIGFDINDNGIVAGETGYTDDVALFDFFSMVWSQNDGLISYDEWFSTAYSINNHGQITGISIEFENFMHGIYVTDNLLARPWSTIDFLEGGDVGDPYAINNNGAIAGSIDFLQETDNNSLTALQSSSKSKDIYGKLLRITDTRGLYGYSHVIQMLRHSTFDQLVNKNGQIISGFDANQMVNDDLLFRWDKDQQNQIIKLALDSQFQPQAFIWDPAVGTRRLGTLGGEWSTAFDINDKDQVVGYSDIGNGKHRAFYWDKEHGMIELPTFGGNSIARAINNNGQIVGVSYDENDNFFPVMWEVSFEPKKLVFSKDY